MTLETFKKVHKIETGITNVSPLEKRWWAKISFFGIAHAETESKAVKALAETKKLKGRENVEC